MQISKEYLNALTCKFYILFWIKFAKFRHITRISSTNRRKVINSQKWSSFFGPPCIIVSNETTARTLCIERNLQRLRAVFLRQNSKCLTEMLSSVSCHRLIYHHNMCSKCPPSASYACFESCTPPVANLEVWKGREYISGVHFLKVFTF